MNQTRPKKNTVIPDFMGTLIQSFTALTLYNLHTCFYLAADDFKEAFIYLNMRKTFHLYYCEKGLDFNSKAFWQKKNATKFSFCSNAFGMYSDARYKYELLICNVRFKHQYTKTAKSWTRFSHTQPDI